MYCLIAVLLTSGDFEERWLYIEQILWESEYSYKVRYNVPGDTVEHYFNRGLVVTGKDKCKKEVVGE